MLTNSIVASLKTSSDWQALEEHIKSEVETLSSIEGIDFLDKEKAAIEGQARVLAKEVLKKILEPFYSVEQEPSDKIAATKNKTGLS